TDFLTVQMADESRHAPISVELIADRPSQAVQKGDEDDLVPAVVVKQLRRPNEIRRREHHTGQLIEAHEVDPDGSVRGINPVDLQAAEMRERLVQKLTLHVRVSAAPWLR